MPAGFSFHGNIDGGNKTNIKKYVVVDTDVISVGEVLTLTSGEAAEGASGDTTFLGVAMEAVDNTDDGETVKVLINPYAIFSVTDNNARVAGATLDLASGGMGVTTTNNADFVVVADSAADEPTLVMFNGTHVFQL